MKFEMVVKIISDIFAIASESGLTKRYHSLTQVKCRGALSAWSGMLGGL